jgi:hypothetical protein
MESAITLFPDPDSPNTPKVSPAFRVKDTLFTALTTPRVVKKKVFKFLTERRGLVLLLLGNKDI